MMSLSWQFFSANWARIMVLQPWFDAIGMENMPTGQKYSFVSDFEISHTYGASGHF